MLRMESLSRTIDTSWFQLREKLGDLDLLEKNLDLTTALLEESSTNINLCVEEGIAEYKRQLLGDLFTTADSLQYDSRNLARLASQAERLSCLVYATAIQFDIARGQIKLKSRQPEESLEAQQEDKGPDIREIIRDVGERIRKDPGFRARQEVKNILVQIKLYQREMEELNKLRASIPQEKLPGLVANFRKRYSEIGKSISDNYKAINREESSKLREQLATHPLQRYELHTLEGLYRLQLKELSRIRSTVIFIEKERYQTRDYIVGLVREKDDSLGLVTRESSAYEKLGAGKSEGQKISRMIGNEIIAVLAKQISWRKTKREA